MILSLLHAFCFRGPEPLVCNQNIILLKVVLAPESDLLEHVRMDTSGEERGSLLVSQTISTMIGPMAAIGVSLLGQQSMSQTALELESAISARCVLSTTTTTTTTPPPPTTTTTTTTTAFYYYYYYYEEYEYEYEYEYEHEYYYYYYY